MSINTNLSLRKRHSTSQSAHPVSSNSNRPRTRGIDLLLLSIWLSDFQMDSMRSPHSHAHASPPLESIEGTASRQASNTLAIIMSPGSEALDHKSSNPKLAMSEDSAQLPYGGKLRSMIRKVLPRFKEKTATAMVASVRRWQVLPWAVNIWVVKLSMKMKGPYVLSTFLIPLVKFMRSVNIHLITQYNPRSRTTRSS